DGAGALVLSRKGGDHPILVDAYVESMGLGRAPGETMALGVEAGVALAHGSSPVLLNVHAQRLHHIWPDLAALGPLGDELTLTGLKHMLERTGVHPGDVTHYILPIPGKHFMSEKQLAMFRDILGIPSENRIRFHLDELGYCGGAAGLVQLDYMARRGLLHA